MIEEVPLTDEQVKLVEKYHYLIDKWVDIHPYGAECYDEFAIALCYAAKAYSNMTEESKKEHSFEYVAYCHMFDAGTSFLIEENRNEFLHYDGFEDGWEDTMHVEKVF